MGHNLLLTMQPFVLQHQAHGIFPRGGNDPLPCQKAGKKVAPSQEEDLVEWLWGRFDQLDAERQKDDQLASVRRWGESCCPRLPKGQKITHVPVSRWKGKFPEACLIFLSILNSFFGTLASLGTGRGAALQKDNSEKPALPSLATSGTFLSLQHRKGDTRNGFPSMTPCGPAPKALFIEKQATDVNKSPVLSEQGPHFGWSWGKISPPPSPS